MRLFVAIHPDADARVWLAEAQRRLRRALRPFDRDLRWVAPESIHVTLAFLGEMPDAGPVAEALQGCRWAPMELTVGGLGVFPNLRRPNVVWAGVADASGELARLQAEVVSALATLVEPERRRFEPHLTLARIRPGSDARLGKAVAKMMAEWVETPGVWRVEGFALMRSELCPAGARHSVVRRFGPA